MVRAPRNGEPEVEVRPTNVPPRRKVVQALLSSAAATLLLAWAFASIIRSWEASHDVGNYWLLPINNTRFWFYVFFPGGVVVVAGWARRPLAWALIAFVVMQVGSAGSVYFWTSRARALPAGITRAEAIDALKFEPATPLALGAITLLGLVSVLLGIRDVLREVTYLRPLERVPEAADEVRAP